MALGDKEPERRFRRHFLRTETEPYLEMPERRAVLSDMFGRCHNRRDVPTD
jgi:hypothetical protein